MTQKRIQILIGVGVVVVLGVLAFWLAVGSHVPSPADTQEPIATTTPGTTGEAPVGGQGGVGTNTLPPEPVFVLPSGATALDDYAFIKDDQVYFRSLTNKDALAIPNSDADTFTKISDFIVFPGQEIVNTCGASATYGYYSDKDTVYFYQFWRAPKFRSSSIEVMVGVDPDTFKVTGETAATDDTQIIKASYEKATTTCKILLTKVDFTPTN